MHVIASLARKAEPTREDLAKLDLSKLDNARIEQSLALVKKEYDQLGGTDQVAKGPALLASTIAALKTTYPHHTQ